MVQKDKNFVETITDKVDSVLDAGHAPTTTAVKRIMCLLLLIMALLMVLMGFGTVMGWFVDFTGLDTLWNAVISLIGGGAEAVSDIPTVE